MSKYLHISPTCPIAAARHQLWRLGAAVWQNQMRDFVVLPKRWIVQRTVAWLDDCGRLAKDWECLSQNGLAFLKQKLDPA